MNIHYQKQARKRSELYTNPVNVLADYMRRRRRRMRRPDPGGLMRHEIADRYLKMHGLK